MSTTSLRRSNKTHMVHAAQQKKVSGQTSAYYYRRRPNANKRRPVKRKGGAIRRNWEIFLIYVIVAMIMILWTVLAPTPGADLEEIRKTAKPQSIRTNVRYVEETVAFEVSGFYAEPGYVTTSGNIAEAGRTIAANTALYPYGSQIRINGTTYIVEEYCKSGLQIYFDKEEDMIHYGFHNVEAMVKILRD